MLIRGQWFAQPGWQPGLPVRDGDLVIIEPGQLRLTVEVGWPLDRSPAPALPGQLGLPPVAQVALL
jgi:hypothetical protein